MAQDSFTGKAGSVSIGGSLVITKWDATVKTEMAKSTDSSNYDVASGRLASAQLHGEESIEATVEGHYSLASTSTSTLKQMFATAPVPATLSFTRTADFCTGNFDVSEFKTGIVVEGATTVDFSCTLMGNGLITYA